jgi:8-oxo-dGTP diphosphatase
VEDGVEQETPRLDDLSSTVIRAAGGVISRNEGDDLEVLLVHRPKYDDWSLPKGKAEPGETDEETARREVEEETGLRCRLGRELDTVKYRDRYDRPKRVRYWLMQPESDSPDARADNEIDAVRWLPLADAVATLSYDHDRTLLRHAFDA